MVNTSVTCLTHCQACEDDEDEDEEDEEDYDDEVRVLTEEEVQNDPEMTANHL